MNENATYMTGGPATSEPPRANGTRPKPETSASSEPFSKMKQDPTPINGSSEADAAPPVQETTPERPLSEAEKLARVQEVLDRRDAAQADAGGGVPVAGGEADGGDDEGAGEGEGGGEAPPDRMEAVRETLQELLKAGKTPKELSVELNIPPEFVYKMHVPVGDDGETATLEELKGLFQSKSRLEREFSERDDALSSREADQVFEEQLLRETMARHGIQLTQQDREAYHERAQTAYQAEVNKLLSHAPELDDPAVLAGFRDKAVAKLRAYGAREHELHHVSATELLILRELFQAQERLARREAGYLTQPKLTPPATTKGSSSKPKATTAGRRPMTERGRVEAIGKIMNGGG